MDITCSKFRDHSNPKLFDNRIFIINSEKTDRKKIAKALEILHNKNVKVVGVDLLFDTLYNNQSDTLLQKSINARGNFIFANTFSELKSGNETSETLNSDPFLVPDSLQYYVNLATDDGFTVRTFEPYHVINGQIKEAFSVALARHLRPEVTDDIKKRKLKKEWINFRRYQFGSQTQNTQSSKYSFPNYPIVGIDKFLMDSMLYTSSYFEDKIVLIGFCGDGSDLSLKDRYFTPLNHKSSGRSFPDMHGVVIHANIISMLLDKDFINEVPGYRINIYTFLIFFLNYFIFNKVLQKKLFFNLPFIRVIQLIQFIILFSVSIWLLANFNIKVSFVFLVTAVILSYELFEFYNHKLQDKVVNLYSALKDKLTSF